MILFFLHVVIRPIILPLDFLYPRSSFDV
jgi:hypothetical protein